MSYNQQYSFLSFSGYNSNSKDQFQSQALRQQKSCFLFVFESKDSFSKELILLFICFKVGKGWNAFCPLESIFSFFQFCSSLQVVFQILQYKVETVMIKARISIVQIRNHQKSLLPSITKNDPQVSIPPNKNMRPQTSLEDDVSLQLCSFLYIYNQMKQQISGEVLSHSHEHEYSRKEKIEKKRKIRKQKVQKSHIDFTDLRSIDTSKLSREEKAKVQKAKNREAAQRSRDMHKEYVSNLQKEVKDLKELLGKSRKFCWRCQKDMEESTILDSYSNQHIIQSKQVQEQRNFHDFEQQQGLIHDQSPINNSIFGEQQYFLRAQSQEESYPYMKSIFFVSMVLLAVICVSSITKQKLQSRALMEIPQLQAKEQINKYQQLQINLNDVRNLTQDKNKTAVVKVESPHYGLIAFNNDDCIKSLIKSTQPTPYIKKSLTSYSDAPSQNSLAYSEGALVCSMPKAKAYKNQPTQQRSPLVRLYLLGSQVKELISNFGLMVPIMDTNIQLNGIYQVLAKIKEVNMVTNHNCLL